MYVFCMKLSCSFLLFTVIIPCQNHLMEEIFKKLPIMDQKVEEEVPLVLIVMMTKSSTFEKKSDSQDRDPSSWSKILEK